MVLAYDFFKEFKSKLETVYDKEEAKAIVSLLLEETLLLKEHQLQLINKHLDESETTYYQSILERLLKAEPIQYILGYTWFNGLKIAVNKNTLIPRPETEELVINIIKHYKDTAQPKSIVDIGTGSGCIPIALKKALPNSSTYGIDISTEALSVAKQNAIKNNTAISFCLTDVLNQKAISDFFMQCEHPICLLSNPPYIAQNESALMHPNVLQYEPHTALFVPDNDALLFYKAIADIVNINLKKGDSVWLEINPLLADETLQLFRVKGLETACVINDISNKKRFIRIII